MTPELEKAIDVFFKGKDIQQHEWEMRTFLQMALDELKPERTVELGTYKGCTAALLSLVTSAKTISLDITDYGVTSESHIHGRNLEFILTDARSEGCAKRIVARLGGLVDLLFFDDGHFYADHVAELNAWKPFVRPGGWMVFHDINPLANRHADGNQPPECQTTKFWQELIGDKTEIIATEAHKAFRGVIPHGGIGILKV